MCRCRLTALRPPRRALGASAEGTEGHIAALFTEPQWPSPFRAFASTLEGIDTAPNIFLHLLAAAITYHLSVLRHLTATVSRVRIAPVRHGQRGLLGVGDVVRTRCPESVRR